MSETTLPSNSKSKKRGVPYKFLPPLYFSFLSPYYDLFGKITRSERFYWKVADFISLKNSEKILDVGCGSGALVIILKQRFSNAEVFGIDPDKKILKLARNKTQERKLAINFKEAFAEDLPFGDGFFDIVVSTLAIHHLPSEFKKKAFREIYRVLKTKGKFLFVGFGKPRNLLLTKIVSIQNLFEYTKDHYEGKIPKFIKEAGFSKIKEIYFQWPNIQFLECRKR